MKKNNVIVAIYNFLFALTTGVVGAIILSWPLLYIFVSVQKTYEIVNMTVLKVMDNYNQLMGYLIWPFNQKLKMTNFPTSANAAQHFADVKKLFILAIAVFLICIIIWLIAKKYHQVDYLQLDKAWIILLMVIPILIVPFAVTNFDSFFVFFHHMFFSNSNWLFDPATDPIIDVLTEEFFGACFAAGGIIYELYFVKQLMHK